MPRESDCKTFRKLVPVWRERYIAKCNAEIARLLADSTKTETERFWKVAESTEKEGRVLVSCLDGHSRSNMFMFMAEMVAHGMVTEEDITDFSKELQEDLAFAFENKHR